MRLAAPAYESAEAGLDLPELGGRLVDRTTGAERLGYRTALNIGRAQNRVASPGRLDRAPDLAARLRLIVDDRHLEPVAARDNGCRHARRPRAHNEHVHATHVTSRRLPLWRATRIPWHTGFKQVWTEATPSTSARHSKQTPIMQ